MIRYPQGIKEEGNNGTIRRSGKADEGRTGRDSGFEEAMGVSAAQADRPVGHRVMLDNDPGGEGFDEMEERGREERFRQFLELPHGIPDQDTFRRIFERVNPAELMKCLQNWLGGKSEAGGRQVAIDGKTIRGSGQEGDHGAVHMVSAWVNENNLVLGQLAAEESETTFPPVMK
jgi:hypothetical protein